MIYESENFYIQFLENLIQFQEKLNLSSPKNMNITQSTQIGLKLFSHTHTQTEREHKIGKANLFGVVEKHLKRKKFSE